MRPRRWVPYRLWQAAPRPGPWEWVLTRLLGQRQELAYVGITSQRPTARWAQHIATQPWAGTIVAMEADRRVFRTETAALAHESKLIYRESPVHNIAGGGRPGRGATRVRRRRP